MGLVECGISVQGRLSIRSTADSVWVKLEFFINYADKYEKGA